jgi:putative DNA primase/helicase
MNSTNRTTPDAISDANIITSLLSEKYYAELLNSGLSDRDIIDCGFRSIDNKKECKRLTGYEMTGLVIPYFTATGQPATRRNGASFYRIKPDWVVLDDSKEPPKYLSPKDEGSRPYFAPTYKYWKKALQSSKIPFHITEGEKTAAKIGSCGFATIGLSGVTAFLDKSRRNEHAEESALFLVEDNEDRGTESSQLETSRVLPELEFLGDENMWMGRTVYITFDSDIIYKPQVKSAMKGLGTWLKSMGAYPYLVLLPTEINRDKNGADDFLFRHGVEAYQKLIHSAEPALKFEKKKVSLNLPDDPGLYQKASLLWGVLKEHWRYRPGVGWHQWTGKCWSLTDDGADTYIDEDIYQFMAANGWKVQTNASLANLLRHMKAKLMVKEWNPKHKIAFQNGVLDIQTREFQPGHRREDFITVQLPYPYAPGADCRRWKRFLLEALKGDRKAVRLVQALFLWALLPKSKGKADLEIGWDLYGLAGTGKGTVLETLKNLIGEHNCGNFTNKSIGNPNVHASLIDKRVSISSDESGHLEEFGIYGKIMSNEIVPVKFLYKNIGATTLNTCLVRAYNNIPSAPAGSKGLDRRIIAMTFNAQPKTIDTDLQDKIDAELSGIFNWAFSLSRTEMKRRILWAGEVDAVKEASEELFLANNSAFVFLQETYPDGAERVRIRDLYHQYAEWMKDTPSARLSPLRFSRLIQTFGCKQHPKINGYFPFDIPALGNVNIIQTFGILRGKTKDIQVKPSPETAKNGELGELGELQDRTIPHNSPQIESHHSSDSGAIGESGELGECFSETIISSSVFAEKDTTKPSATEESNIVSQPQPEILEQPPIPSPNPKGVITHTRYLKGEIGAVKIQFKTKALAKEWKDLIDLIFGYNPEIKQNNPAVNGYKWYVYCDKFDRDALTRLERKDLSQSPPNRE